MLEITYGASRESLLKTIHFVLHIHIRRSLSSTPKDEKKGSPAKKLSVYTTKVKNGLFS